MVLGAINPRQICCISIQWAFFNDESGICCPIYIRQSTGVVEGLIKELERHFHAHDLMNATRIIYPCWYWEAHYMEMTFLGYLTILKAKFCHPRAIFVSGTLVVGLLNPTLFDKKTYLFLITMKRNSHVTLHSLLDCNLQQNCKVLWLLIAS